MKLENFDSVRKHGVTIKRVGTNAVISYEEIDDFMYIFLESDRVSSFRSDGKLHLVYDYHNTFDFIIATDFKKGYFIVPERFTEDGHYID